MIALRRPGSAGPFISAPLRRLTVLNRESIFIPEGRTGFLDKTGFVTGADRERAFL